MNTAPMTDDFAQTILQFEITHNALQKLYMYIMYAKKLMCLGNSITIMSVGHLTRRARICGRI